MNISKPIPSTVTSVSFSFLTTEDVRRISVKQITNPVLLDDLNRPNVGGLYDPALGPSERNDICATCHQTAYSCPGHFGHIELPAPLFHPLFMGHMYTLLRSTCMYCHRLKLARPQVIKYIAKLQLLEHGLLDAAIGLDNLHIKTRSKDDDDDDGPEEGVAAFEQRVKLYVQLSLMQSSGSKRDNYKDSLVFQARKDLIMDFHKAAVAQKKCQNTTCGAPGYTYRKEGHTKIVEYELSVKQKAVVEALGLRRPNVLLYQQKTSKTSQARQENTDDSDEDMSDAEPAGEATFSDDEQPASTPANGEQLPKAANGRVKTSRGRNERIIAAEECRAHLRLLFKKEMTLLSLVFGRHGPLAPVTPQGLSIASADMFFLDVIPVTPTRFRPPAKMGEILFEHAQNELLAKVINTSYRLRDLNVDLRKASIKSDEYDEAARRKILGSLLESLIQLQVDVNSFIDSSKNPAPVRQGKLPPAGIKQGLEKKEGLFRKHMMGKRVNYAARSVISPDVNIEPNEIGVPPVFARKLTFPEPVTPANFHEMRQLVINGPKNYPGASIVEYEDGHQVYLDKLSVEQRTAIANQLMTPQDGGRSAQGRGIATRTPAINKKVYRHLRDGDMLILNRQPTLHKPSMMAHKARILLGEKTIRMHYANCNSYNADFDGDEMNIHFPQSEVARAEAMFIANTDNQYLVPTSGKPLRGLIQDHVVAGVWMTNRDTFFTREEYFQLLYGALRPEEETSHHSGRLQTLPPTVWKPRPMWTGKQIISTVLLNITPSNAEGLNLNHKAKVPGALWGVGSKEDEVIFMDGELLCGVLDKSSFGASDFGLVHSVYELYGADVAGRLLGILGRLFTKFLQHRAFTCRMDDLALTEEGNTKRAAILREGENLGTEGAIENFPSLKSTPSDEVPTALVHLLRDVLRDDSKMAGLDMTVKTRLAKLTKQIADAVMPHGLLRQFPHNNMQAMTQSGAKGSPVNAQQISCALGQQELEGRRVPVMISGKTLPSFKAFETKAIAGGYVASRFLTGVKPQEFFFHCMAGREGLIDTAVKTSRSGYLQRSLIKHLEGIRVHYDNTVRGSDNSVYQFHYGGDALDVTKQKHLYQFTFIAQNAVSLMNRYQPRQALGVVNDDEAVKYMKKLLKTARKDPDAYAQSDTAMSMYSPVRYLGATSEKFAQRLEHYIKSNPDKLLKSSSDEEIKIKRRRGVLSSKDLRLVMLFKYLRSIIEPGEAVGLLAGQGVGEPSTQMTLNTFHFAGHGAANVTLGIPRLRELIMTASTKPKTPSMTMTVTEGNAEEEVDAFARKASRLTLSQVIDNITVTESLAVNGQARSKNFKINISFFPEEEYRTEYDVDPTAILGAFGTRFPLILKKEVQTELRKLDADMKSQIAELGKGKKVTERSGEAEGADEGDEGEPSGRSRDDDEESEVGDGDATSEKRKRQSAQQATYESDEDEDEGSEGGELDDAAIEAAYASEDGSGSDEGAPKVKKGKGGLKALVAKTEEAFLENFPNAMAFAFQPSGCQIELEFGSDLPKLLLVGIVERTALKTVVREIPGIADCFRVREKSKDGSVKITTNGSNFRGIWDFACTTDEPMIDENDIYSNDIYAILNSYGVEMARAAIVREMSGVFGVYNIDVDFRHLELIADYMTFEGGYKPFNRKGIGMHPSPLLKASFETTAAFLSDATLYGDFDDLSTPSSNLVVGRPTLTGTGVFDIVTPLHQDDPSSA
ncbi:beta and beta-prime subunits of DNA dependent RNA-polymerase [Auriscalpium vulgare]|uniref:Beta and beta-prime subunits of DNA dependent RNA-polymerase n=1 Tax=Auriscalpium vulgare TaxID=40419 RepID=A0ACB8R943_9AGAM|nr:beta and beta-prime subunits of DNA dependent RNA-polymerase [Auriscalpium vulgare]